MSAPPSLSPPDRTAVIIGAGPAGLTAARELLTRSDVMPLVLEKSDMMGGIARTISYKGNRIDIGGHRFFSKSDRVMHWWLERMPMEQLPESQQTIAYHRMSHKIEAGATGLDPERTDRVMLLRQRRSRIYYLRRFFDYPLALNKQTILNLGLIRMARIGFSYLKSALFPIRNEETLEHFFINRFGRELYRTFFESYTEKVWGVPCNKISAEWGAQRVKGLSVLSTLANAARKLFPSKGSRDIAQKNVETSLIEQFLYPKYGPGQMWEEVCGDVRRMGGQVITHQVVEQVLHDGCRVSAVVARNTETGDRQTLPCSYAFSTMPVRELMRALDPLPPQEILEVSDGLVYRDFITVGLLVRELKINEDGPSGAQRVRDNWIYIQEPEVMVGRLQIFNNWSPYMVADPNTVWIGLEYFCNDTDNLWKMSDSDLIALAKDEMSRIGIIDPAQVLDATVIRIEKAYPAYFGTYDRFDLVRDYLNRFENLFPIGRNGMHKYNNQDHSMLTAMMAVDNILAGRTDKSNLWEVNTEQDYHEDQRLPEEAPATVAS